MDIKETGSMGVRVNLVQDRVQIRALVNTIRSFRAPQKAGNLTNARQNF
jgi:hypothetical protein